MKDTEILSYANTVVSVLGNKKTAQKYIVQRDEHGLAVGKTDIKTVCERAYDGFGFEISFLEDSLSLVAIWFCGKLVFNTICDEYDPDSYSYRSAKLMRLVDEESSDYQAGNVYLPGDWEKGLTMLAQNAEIVRKKLLTIRQESEKTNAWIMNLNERMLRLLPFKLSGRWYEPQDRAWSDDQIVVTGDELLLQVYVYTGGKSGLFTTKRPAKLVFDAAKRWYQNGPWVEHLEDVLQKRTQKLSGKAAKYGFDLEDELSGTVRKFGATVNAGEPTSEADCLEKIRIYSNQDSNQD